MNIILCDMDDVMENLAEAWVEELNERYGLSVDFESVESWELGEYFPELSEKQIYEVLEEESVWKRTKPRVGAVEYLKKLCDLGEVWIVTSTHYKNIGFKVKWVLERYFPFIGVERLIVTQNKQMIKGDFLIDDNVKNLIGGEYTPVLMGSHHNKEVMGFNRKETWEEVYEFINSKMLANR